MSWIDVTFLAGLIFGAAALYSTVGHAGASAYLAILALYGLAPPVMKGAALVLNILVAVVAATKFYQAGHFSWRVFWPFAAGSVPLAFLGGSVKLDPTLYKKIVGLVLLFSAWRLFFLDDKKAGQRRNLPAPWVGVACGAVLGFVSGIVGVGGGIFLSPLLLLAGWAGAQTTAAVSALFILVNSVSGLLGHLSGARGLPAAIWIWAGAAVAGGFAGAHLGSRKFDRRVLLRLLAVVLVLAGIKLVLV